MAWSQSRSISEPGSARRRARADGLRSRTNESVRSAARFDQHLSEARIEKWHCGNRPQITSSLSVAASGQSVGTARFDGVFARWSADATHSDTHTRRRRTSHRRSIEDVKRNLRTGRRHRFHDRVDAGFPAIDLPRPNGRRSDQDAEKVRLNTTPIPRRHLGCRCDHEERRIHGIGKEVRKNSGTWITSVHK